MVKSFRTRYIYALILHIFTIWIRMVMNQDIQRIIKYVAMIIFIYCLFHTDFYALIQKCKNKSPNSSTAESYCSRFLSHKISNVIAPSCEIDKLYTCVECRLLLIDVKECAKKILYECVYIYKCVEENDKRVRIKFI